MTTEIEPLGDFSALTLGKVKGYLLIEYSLKDAQITEFISAAVAICEKQGRCIINPSSVTARFDLSRDEKCHWLPYAPTGVSSVKAVKRGWGGSESDSETEVASRFLPATGYLELKDVPYDYDELVVTYTAGVSGEVDLSDQGSRAHDLYLAVLEVVATFWENRAVDEKAMLPKKSLGILQKYWDSPTYHPSK